MGTCNYSGKSLFESLVDNFFKSMKITSSLTEDIIILIEKNLNQGIFCENNIEIFRNNILKNVASSNDATFCDKVDLFWINSFTDFNDTHTLSFLSSIILLSNGEYNVKTESLQKIYKLLNANENSNNFLKEHLKTILSFYINFVSFYSLTIIKDLCIKNEFYPTLSVVYKIANREVLCSRFLGNYIFFEIDLNEFIFKELKDLNHEMIRLKLFEINRSN